MIKLNETWLKYGWISIHDYCRINESLKLTTKMWIEDNLQIIEAVMAHNLIEK